MEDACELLGLLEVHLLLLGLVRELLVYGGVVSVAVETVAIETIYTLLTLFTLLFR